MKKTLLALAVATLSANAFAVNLDNPAAVGGAPQVFAKEIKVAPAGTDIGTTAVTASVKAGFALSEGFVRFDLTNGAKFETNPSLTVSSLTTPGISVASGGAGFDFVIFKVTDTAPGPAPAPVGITAAATVTLNSAGNGITVVNKDAVGISYGLYETAGAAASKSGALNSKSGTLLSFAPALDVKAVSAVAGNKIDAIAKQAKEFVPGGATTKVTPLVTLTNGVVAAPATPLRIDGTTAVAYGDIVASQVWKLDGNFSAVDASSAIAGFGAGSAVAADKQSVTVPAGAINYTVSGATEIAETSVSALYTPTATANYEVSPVSFSNVAKLEKNGQDAAVDLALKPGGAYANYVRITNKDTISGAFFIKVINDAGQSVSFPLSAVAGQPATLAAGASTQQMTIDQILLLLKLLTRASSFLASKPNCACW